MHFTVRAQSSGPPLPPSTPPLIRLLPLRSEQRMDGWMEGKRERAKWMYVWRSRSIGYYHQHTLNKMYGNDLNHFTS